MLRTGFEDSCYEHIPLAKSGEDNRWIQLKEVDWGACFHTVDDCSTFFWADILQAKNGELVIVVYFTCFRCTHTPFHMTTFTLFLSYENPTNCSFYRILTTEIHHL